MSKKNSLLTPEELAAKKIRKSNGWTRFWAIVLAAVLVFGVFAVAKSNGAKVAEEVKSETTTGTDSAANANASAGWDSGASSDTNAPAAANAPADANANANAPAGDSNAAATAANAINAATAKASKGAYKFHRNCVIDNVDVGSATETLNGIIKRVDENADLNSVVGGFLDKGELDKNMPADKADMKEKFMLKSTSLKAEDLQNLKVEGNKYSFTLAAASNPQKDNSTALSRLTNDFITFDEVKTGVADALGGLSFLLSVKSADVEFKDIKVTVTIDNGNLKELHYSYYMDVKSLELSVATGTGHGTVEGTYTA